MQRYSEHEVSAELSDCVLENIQGCGMVLVSLSTQCLCCCHDVQMFILRLYVFTNKRHLCAAQTGAPADDIKCAPVLKGYPTLLSQVELGIRTDSICCILIDCRHAVGRQS
jgi:hypothetical protein